MASRSKSRRRKPRESDLALIERLLFAPVQINRSGKVTRITAIEAIMLQLTSKMMAGSARAGRLLLKYQDLFKSDEGKRLELEFIDNEYTRALAGSTSGAANE